MARSHRRVDPTALAVFLFHLALAGGVSADPGATGATAVDTPFGPVSAGSEGALTIELPAGDTCLTLAAVDGCIPTALAGADRAILFQGPRWAGLEVTLVRPLGDQPAILRLAAEHGIVLAALATPLPAASPPVQRFTLRGFGTLPALASTLARLRDDLAARSSPTPVTGSPAATAPAAATASTLPPPGPRWQLRAAAGTVAVASRSRPDLSAGAGWLSAGHEVRRLALDANRELLSATLALHPWELAVVGAELAAAGFALDATGVVPGPGEEPGHAQLEVSMIAAPGRALSLLDEALARREHRSAPAGDDDPHSHHHHHGADPG